MDFHEISYLNILKKNVKKIKVSVKSDTITGTLHEDEYVFLIISCSFLLRMRNVSEKCKVNQNTYFVFSNFFFKNRVVYGVIWKKYCRAGQITDENMVHAHCVLDN
jgi:hypothetical protein